MLRHGHTAGRKPTRVHSSWGAMLARCYRKSHFKYSDYGGRGITVCERWHSFENFLADMGEPAIGQTIDRIDPNGNYEPGNCRWASRAEQANNRRSCIRVEMNGKIQTLAQWCKALGRNYHTTYNRVASGWPAEKALLDAVDGRRKNGRRWREYASE